MGDGRPARRGRAGDDGIMPVVRTAHHSHRASNGVAAGVTHWEGGLGIGTVRVKVYMNAGALRGNGGSRCVAASLLLSLRL